MPIELRIRGGARDGYTETFDKSVIAIGRHPLSDLRFDPQIDLDVSTRHGEIRSIDGKYSIYDAQSTNGTFVNGQRVAPGGVQELKDRDVIAFGPGGPQVSVRLSKKTATPTTPRKVPPAPQAPPASPPRPPTAVELLQTAEAATPPRKTKSTTGERVAIAVAKQTRKLWYFIAAAVVVLGGLSAVLYSKTRRDDKEIDSLMRAYAEAQEKLATAFASDTHYTNSQQRHIDSLEKVVRAGGAARAQATAQLQRDRALQLKLSEMDAAAIVKANENALVLVTSQIGAEQPNEATGFVVTSSGLIITNRHVVMDDAGTRAAKLFVKLANNAGTHRAHIVRVATDSLDDLAVIQLEGAGTYPAVRVATSVDTQVGAAVLTLGFPLGTDLPMEGSSVKPTLTTGVVTRTIKDLVQMESFASHGASGSPVFDSHGHVIGVVWGGPKGTGGRIVYAVPADRINELIKAAK